MGQVLKDNTALCLVVMLLAVTTDDVSASQEDKVCYNQEVQVVQTNVSYLSPYTEVTFEWCWSWTFRCKKEITTWMTRFREENITRLVSKPVCCPGYTGQVEACEPICPGGCSRGNCSAPGLCTCETGYSGERCQIQGCPPGLWGPGCTNHCTCAPGLGCDAINGSCICPAGLTGPPLCTIPCPMGRYGSGCSGRCNCSEGSYCHAVTGECVTCPPGRFGVNCGSACACNATGTAMCSHLTGECYCRGNWFGAQCQLNCPFGYERVNQTCLGRNDSGVCKCPNLLYRCDPVLGCICPQGTDCGIEQIEEFQQVDVGYLQASESHRTVIIAVTVTLMIGLMVLVSLVVYYRRRIRRMEADLRNRAGVNNEGVDPHDDIFNPDPLPPIPHLVLQDIPGKSASPAPPAYGVDNPSYGINKALNRPEDNVANVAISPHLQDKNYGSTKSVDEGDSVYQYQDPTDLNTKWNILKDFQDKYTLYGKNSVDASFEFEDEFYPDSYDHLDHARANNAAQPKYATSTPDNQQ